MPESFPRRWPWLTFAVLPFACIVVVSLTLAAGLVSLSEMHLAEHWFVQKAFFLVRGLLIWGAPAGLSAFFAYVAHRSRVPLRWPVLATGIICTLAAMTNVDLVLNPPGGAPGGTLNIGFGTGPDAWPGQLPRLLLTACVVLVPLVLATRKRSQDVA